MAVFRFAFPVLACALTAACTSPLGDDGASLTPAPAPAPAATDAPAPVSGGALDASADAAVPANDDDVPWSGGLEICGDAIDNDGDGLVDEDCSPSFFVGVFPPTGGGDLALTVAGGGHVARMEADLGRPLSVIQTYRATNTFDSMRARTELGEIWKHGSVPHLYLEPAGYSATQYANAGTDPGIAADLQVNANALADALALHPIGRMFISFGAEMNGNWTTWGCKNASAATFIAVTRKMHVAVATAIAAKAIDARRVRWVYAPNNESSGGCGSAAAYYPGHDVVDLLGMSAYRANTESVDAAVLAPTKKLMGDLAYPATWRRDRFIVLQTGSKTIAGDNRGVWLAALVKELAADPAYAGVIPFDLSDSDPSRDWALLDRAKPAVARSGYDAFIGAARALPASDRALEGTFEPFFWDVHLGDASYAEIQALRSARITSGCSTAPPLFCPSAPITRAGAAALLAGAFGVSVEDATTRIAAPCRSTTTTTPPACPAEPLRRADLALAIASLLGVKRPLAKKDLARLQSAASVEPSRDATRAEAAAWIVHTARTPRAPRP